MHYFDDLTAKHADKRAGWHRRVMERWVLENPPGRGDAWEPYPVSRRIVNWVKWAALGNELPPICEASLAIQSRWLTKRLEYHLLGNHLLANARALVHAGLYFAGAEAQSWYRHGMAILDEQLTEQVLADGGHFELSPMYHAGELEGLLDVINVHRAYGEAVPPRLLRALVPMRRWLSVMTHPDGGIAFFNDSAFLVTPCLDEIDLYAARLGLAIGGERPREPVTLLDSSGYVRLESGPACLICDCAALGPDYLLGHAHADTLSFEFSLARHRVFVNSGTSQYGWNAERQRQRGTAAHNTVVIDDEDSSEVWAGFRVARRARARLVRAEATAEGMIVEANHDGYRRLPGRNIHSRRWTLQEHSLWIEDTVSGRFGRAAAHFHLHPAVDASLHGSNELVLSCPDGWRGRMSLQNVGRLDLLPGTWHPEFGVALANRSIVAHFSTQKMLTRIDWARR